MFGGVGYLIHGNMACGVNGDRLIGRLDPQDYETALGKPFVSAFDMTGRPMKGWVVVAPEGLRTEAEIKAWVEQGVAFARTLPQK
jgi:TfoX/Sxy family transcriptional regulator of competence genes